MRVKVRTIAAEEVQKMEALINETLSQPGSEGYEVAAAFPSPDGENIVLICQKP